ncbi:MAG TPA: LysR family transcriptional regulator, partial [Gammaproteobacteria bacterium]|nr:LysR family transcriptional regulator [Gammaproteobacteria bacterium]
MLEEIRNFVAVVQAGSFTRAAEELNSARSVISKRLSQLERQLGVRLLNRTTRRLSLTEAGERFYQECSVSL